MQSETNKLKELNEHDREIIESKLKVNADIVNNALSEYLELDDKDYGVLFESMRYSSLAGGKRIRAFLVMQFYELFRGNSTGGQTDIDIEKSLPLAVAVEMIHTYSLIHDDLPCMDNDDMRRGKPTNHKKYGEATALLAGDALLTYAFNIVANTPLLSPEEKVRIISEMSYAAGHNGMIGGQMMDMDTADIDSEVDKSNSAADAISAIRLIKLHTLKTGNMIMTSARIGCIAGGAGEEEADLAMSYAKNIGLAFQIIDDILDKTGDSVLLGKNTGSDDKNSKTTFLNILSEGDAYAYAQTITLEAVMALDKLKESGKINRDADAAKTLEMLAKYLLDRKA